MGKSPRFDAKWQRRRSWQRRWRVPRVWLLLAAILAASWWIMRWPLFGGEWEQVGDRFTICAENYSTACVIDGDTIMLGKRRIRLTGFDTPEIDGQCLAERKLALAARGALHDWLNRGPFTMDGGTDPPRDTYGRELRALRREEAGSDEWLADWMEARGFARTSGWGNPDRDWCAETPPE